MANSLVLQSCYEIINTGSFVSWNLPKYTSIILSSNPDNGNYNVSSLDRALTSRMLTFHGKFDVKEWAKWAENFGIDGRAINFALYYSTEIFEPKNNVVLANARSYTTFCRAIGGIEKWSDPDSLSFILEISTGCFLGKDNILGNLFTSFISNNLDKLISPERMFEGDWKAVENEIKDCVFANNQWRADLANILATRFLNFIDKYLNQRGYDSKKVQQRMHDIVTSDKGLFSKDILYNVIQTLSAAHPAATNSWYMDVAIRNVLLK